MKNINIISTSDAPKPAGHYSQAVEYNGIVYVSGILPVIPQTGEFIEENISESVIQVFKNLNSVLEAAGSGLDCILKITVYINDIEKWGEINAVYAELMGDSKPARTVIEVSRLHHGVILELDAVAFVRQ